MKNRNFKMIMFFVACIILVASLLSLAKDINFFLTKQEGTAQVLSIEDMGVQKPYRVKVKYYNEWKKKDILCNATLNKSRIAEFKANSSSSVRILYASNYPKDVYLADYKAPNIGIIIFGLIFSALMGLAVYSLRDSFKKK